MTSRPTPIPWTDAERVQLRRLWDNGLGATRIGLLMSRSKHSVGTQIRDMGLRRPVPASLVRPQAAPKPPAPHRAGRTTLPLLPSLAGE